MNGRATVLEVDPIGQHLTVEVRCEACGQLLRVSVDLELSTMVAGPDRSRGRMFALLLNLHGETVLNLKCEPALADQQRSEHPQITPGYHMNKKHWNSVRPGLDPHYVRELIEDSYDLVVDGMPRRDKEYIRLQGTINKGSID